KNAVPAKLKLVQRLVLRFFVSSQLHNFIRINSNIQSILGRFIIALSSSLMSLLLQSQKIG
ncbi:MAG: hypothetical protein LE180_04575, partial [Endomicrobium sp.]|uniref:hypothetical protein n=1 Tax=Candidatus Endomicrobiellum pyrsonymphae TaxID=1408203 RepID=UPI003589979C|nr:hypothetical protein [Endomicrobium sp.]